MAKRKDLNQNVPYQRRLLKRYKLAEGFGSCGYYSSLSKTNAGKKYPMPLAVLQGKQTMVEIEVLVDAW